MNQYPLATAIFFMIALSFSASAKGPSYIYLYEALNTQLDTLPPMWEARNNSDKDKNPFDLDKPAVVEEEVEYDTENNQYIFSEKIGEEFYSSPVHMSFEDYLDYKQKKTDEEFLQRMNGLKDGSSFLGFATGQADDANPLKNVNLDEDILGGLFGGASIDIQPKGFIDGFVGFNGNFNDNPAVPPRNRRIVQPDFDINMNMQVDGGIGDKFRLGWSYNTQSTFDFDNRIKLAYDSEEWSEDEIIKKVEVGDVSLPLNSQLIDGSQRLFGLKTQLQFGKLTLTGLVAQQKSKKKELVIENGGQIREFSKLISEYDENKHFFLTHYNRNTYDRSLRNLPQINTLFKIRKIEVWATNRNQQETDFLSQAIAFSDIGEPDTANFTSNNPSFYAPEIPNHRDIYDGRGLPGFELDSRVGANPLFDELRNDPDMRDLSKSVNKLKTEYGFVQGTDFESARLRRLERDRDYFVHNELGFVSLNRQVETDDILAYAMEYEFNGKIYQIGEFFDDADSILILKLLKSSSNDVEAETWDLMMKNVYSIGAYQVQREDFQLDVFYNDPGETNSKNERGEKRFLPESKIAGKPLIQVLNLDNLNPVGDPQPDGRFDFVPDLTILPKTGKIIFPVIEPFGKTLADSIDDSNLDKKYVFEEMYNTTVFEALQFPESNRYVIRGRYKSDISSNISLGAFNIPPGSVRVTAGGRQLTENIDYEIDYNIGRLKILNESYLASGSIKISFEDNAAFGFQLKTMLGLRADYAINKHMNIGGTFMHLYERPFTGKVNIGDDPINNRVFGLDYSYQKDAPWLTRFVDKIPGIDTKEPSQVRLYAETAFLKPGHSKAIRIDGEDEGTVFLDDFEGSANGIPVESFHGNWMLASTPFGVQVEGEPRFNESSLNDDLDINANRALLSWYRQQAFDIATDADNRSHYTRTIDRREIFPNAQFDLQQRLTPFLSFDMNYFPSERGPYNFDRPAGTAYSEGIDMNGNLREPETRWAGIMTDNNQPDFERANYETLEFWLMSPYLESGATADNDGYLVFNIGSVSEDIMKDGKNFAEHGLPTDGMANNTIEFTNLSKLSTIPPAIFGFENDEAARSIQDVGFDGLDNDEERDFHAEYLNSLVGSLTPAASTAFLNDPANDDYVSIQNGSNGNGIKNRYRRFSMPQGDSPVSQGLGAFAGSEQFKNFPDQEDLDQDGSLDQAERYNEYRIPINHDGLGGLELNEFIIQESVRNVNGISDPVKWYRVKIPLANPTNAVGGINNLRNMQFTRMYVHEFKEETTFRFAEMEFGRNTWRRYTPNIKDDPEIGGADDLSNFDISAVNIEEHSNRTPFNYVIPDGVTRERLQGLSQQVLQQNEQSLSLDIEDLQPNTPKAIFKELFLDLRRYKRLKMFTHLSNTEDFSAGEDGEVKLFIRLGNDYTANYYEYEIPLSYSRDPNAMASDYPKEVWKEENEVDLMLSELIDLKRERNNLGISSSTEHLKVDPITGRKISIIGNPNLGFVRGIMIGVQHTDTLSVDQSKNIDVWINELRVSGLDERGGMAALAQVEAQLADFGTMAVAGNYSSIGYGGLDQKVNDRSLEEVTTIDASINLELGKFFNEESGIRIPFYAQYSDQTSTPEFDPYDLDVKLEDRIKDAEDPGDKERIKEQAVEKNTLKTYNFTNVRKEKTNGKAPMPWDVSNLNVSYAYTEVDKVTPVIELDNEKTYTGSLGYGFSYRPKYIYPFKKLIKKGKYLKIIKDINLNPLPNAYNFNTVVERKFGEARYRFTEPEFSTWYTKRFNWDRNYGLKWDITESLKFNYNSTAIAVIDEPAGKIDSQEKKDSIRTNLRDFGRLKNYNHNVSLSYNLPINKIPILDWMKGKVQYNADYNWAVAALNVDSLGNVISNSQKVQYSADLNFQRLYSKSKYLNKVDRGSKPRARRRPSSGNSSLSKDIQKNAPPSRAKSKKNDIATWEKLLIRPLMTLRQGRFNYTETNSTSLPGFMPVSKYLGQSQDFSAPGWEFIAGLQPNLDSYLDESANKNWITPSLFLNTDVLQNTSTSLDATLKLEPFNDLIIDLSAKQQRTENHSEKFKIFEPGEDWERRVPYDVGSYTISYFTLNTLLGADIDEVFQTFEDNRVIISDRLGDGFHTEDSTYTEGYGALQQDVLIPAFIAAYTDTDPNSVKLDFLKELPKVNWDLSYNGLGKLPFFSNYFKQFALEHSYKSTMSISRYNTESNFNPNELDKLNEQTNNYYSRFEIPNVTINEELNPLIGINTTLNNEMKFGFDYSKTRSLNLNFVADNKHVIESNSSTLNFSFGYLVKDVKMGFLKTKKKKKTKPKREEPSKAEELLDLEGLKQSQLQDLFDFTVVDEKSGDLQLGLDFSIRDDITKNHLIDKDTDQVTRGARTINISPSADYSFNKKINFRAFVEYQSTNPYTTQQFRRANYRGGVTVRLTLE